MANILKSTSAHKGYAVWTGEGSNIEKDTFTCKHCCKVVFIDTTKPMPGGGCYRCGGLICSKCVDLGICIPYEKKLDLLEAAITKRLNSDRNLSNIGIGV